MDIGKLKGVKFLTPTHPAIRNVNKLISLLESIDRDAHLVDPLSGEFDSLDAYLGKGVGKTAYAAWYFSNDSLVQIVRRVVKFTGNPLVVSGQRLAPGETESVRRKVVMRMCVQAVLETARAAIPSQVDGEAA